MLFRSGNIPAIFTHRRGDSVKRVSVPKGWPFVMAKTPECNNTILDDMVSRVRTHAMKRMANKDLTVSTQKKACNVKTTLSTNNMTYVTMVKEVLANKPGS